MRDKVHFAKSPNRPITWLVLFTLGVLTTGCLVQQQAENQNASNDGNFGDGVSIHPAVLCGEGRTVVGVDSSGQVICEMIKLSGQAAKTDSDGNATCSENQDLTMMQLTGSNGVLNIPGCRDVVADTTDDVTLGESPTESFRCPYGSALKGFTNRGEPMCAALVGPELSDQVLVTQVEQCPWSMMAGSVTHSEFTVPTCLYTPFSPKMMTLVDQRVTKFAFQNREVCAGTDVVVGFDEDHNIICRRTPAHLKKPLQRYWTIRYVGGHPEMPICRSGYSAAESYLRWENNTQRPIKIWTCARD